MAVFEVQISASAFLGAQLNALRSRQLCPPPPLTLGGTTIQVQQIDFGINKLRHHVPALFPVFYQSHGETYGKDTEGFKTEIAQDVFLHVSEVSDILAHPNQAPASVVVVPTTAVLELMYYPLDDSCYMRTVFDRLEWGPLPALLPGVDIDALRQQVQNIVAATLPSPAIPFNFASFLTGGITKVENAGVSVDTNLQRIVFRAQPGGATSYVDVPWSNFYKGFIPDRLEGADWAFFVDKGILEGIFQIGVWEAVKEGKPSEIELISVGATYSNLGGKARVDTTIYANVDLPDPLGTTSIQPTINADFSVTAPSTLTLDVYLPDIEAMAKQMILRWIPISLRFLLRPVENVLNEIVESELSDFKTPTLPLPNCSEETPLHNRCSQMMQLPSLGGTQFFFNAIAARDDGISLTGRIQAGALTPATVDTSFKAFEWVSPDVSCGGASMATIAFFASHVEEVAQVVAEVLVTNSGTRPAYICRIQVLHDPLGVFPASMITGAGAEMPAKVVVRVPNPGKIYAANPYSVDLLIITTAGTRLVRLPPAPALKEDDIKRLMAELIIKIGNCYQLMAPWYKYPHGFNPRWHVDPPWDARVDHLWDFTITGLPDGHGVAVYNERQQELIGMVARANTAVRFTMMTRPSLGPELSVVRTAGMPGAVRAAPIKDTLGVHLPEDTRGQMKELSLRGIEVRQTLLWHVASIALGQRCRRVMVSSTWARHGVVSRSWDDGGLRSLEPVQAGAYRGLAMGGPDRRLQLAQRPAPVRRRRLCVDRRRRPAEASRSSVRGSARRGRHRRRGCRLRTDGRGARGPLTPSLQDPPGRVCWRPQSGASWLEAHRWRQKRPRSVRRVRSRATPTGVDRGRVAGGRSVRAARRQFRLSCRRPR